MTEKIAVRKKGNKPTKLALSLRIDKAEHYLAKGLRVAEVTDLLRADYNIVHRTAQNYIYTALRRWKEEASQEEALALRHARRELMRTELTNLYELARKDRSYKDCVQIQDRLAKLDNLYMPEQVEVTVHQGVIIMPQIETEVTWLSCDDKHLEDKN